jgi:DDB1- and CUL4-associated factor 5
LRGTLHYTPDSGIQTAPSGSSGNAMAGGSSVYKPNDTNGTPATVTDSVNGWTGANNSSQKSSYTSKVFQQKIAKVRKNYRNHFGDDSDSD